jgi:hypothetical protein
VSWAPCSRQMREMRAPDSDSDSYPYLVTHVVSTSYLYSCMHSRRAGQAATEQAEGRGQQGEGNEKERRGMPNTYYSIIQIARKESVVPGRRCEESGIV